MNPESNQTAEHWIKYFGNSLEACIQSRDDKNVEMWQKGVNSAKEWHRLIVSEINAKNELLAFIGIIHANKYRNSVWYLFALDVYDWAASKEITLLPHNVFFKSDGLRRYEINEIEKTPPLENAETLYDVFYQYSSEDPNTEVWEEGFRVIKEWIRLMKSQQRTSNEISTLIENVILNFNKYMGVSQWLDTMLAVGYWCKSIGQLDLIPKPHKLLFQDQDNVAENS